MLSFGEGLSHSIGRIFPQVRAQHVGVARRIEQKFMSQHVQ